ncbi:MAG: relaxase [Firmicutes bacterium]|nr:relaxase [Bacillota bacterium]
MPPFVMKIKFYKPGNNTRDKNAAHINYIATRPGADRGEPEVGDRDPDAGRDGLDPAGHVKYAAERPGSHGLFGPDEKTPGLKVIQDELQQHDGIVWRAVLSLREDTAKRLGFVSRESWESALRAGMPEAARAMGISENNLRWVGAFHAEAGHPHVHLVIWEREPKRTRGVISNGERKEVRKAFMRPIYAAERSRLGAEKSAIRDMIRDVTRGEMFLERDWAGQVKKARHEVRILEGDPPGVAPGLYDSDREELARRLEGLAKIMPGKGRIALKYMPEDVKAEAREISDWILGKPGFVTSVSRHKEIARELASHYTSRDESLSQAEQNVYDDLRDRVAQLVLKNAAQAQGRDRYKSAGRDYSFKLAAGSLWRNAWQGIERARSREEARGEMEKRAQEQKRMNRRKNEKGQEQER